MDIDDEWDTYLKGDELTFEVSEGEKGPSAVNLKKTS